jgi:pimeloyl-ACP methyl ester carboxylesterase
MMLDLKTIDIRGAQLTYQEAGDGNQHIILVHANLSDIRSWDTLLPILAQDHHVVAYSRRFAWPNEPIRPNVADPWEEQAEDLAEMIKALNMQPCHILGNSTGATLALLVASMHPGLVGTLFLEEPPVISLFLPRTPPAIMDVLWLLWCHPWDFLPIMRYGIFTIASAEASFKAGNDEEALQTFLHGVVETKAYQALTEARIDQARANLQPHKALFCYGSLPLLGKQDVKAISANAYIFEAEMTAGAQKSINGLLPRLMRNARRVYFPGSTHFLHEDVPEVIANAIRECL